LWLPGSPQAMTGMAYRPSGQGQALPLPDTVIAIGDPAGTSPRGAPRILRHRPDQ